MSKKNSLRFTVAGSRLKKPDSLGCPFENQQTASRQPSTGNRQPVLRRLKIKKNNITVLDGVLLAFVLLVCGYVAYRLTVSLNYHWRWDIIPQYLAYYDPEKKRWVANLLLQGFFTTIKLSVWAMLLGLLMGTVAGVMRTTKRLFNRLVGRTYVELIRNMPPLVLVFIFYFFVSDQIMPLFGVEEFIRSRSTATQHVLSYFFAKPAFFTAFLSGVLTVALFEGAYIAEIVRAGIASIEKGQWEAARALGFSWPQQMRHVIMPQAIKRVLPPLAGEFINTIKYTSIVSVISIQELTFQGMQIMAATRVSIEIWLTIAAMYFVLCAILSMAARRLEQSLARSGI
jgi:polar amino acid transport system permease protein